MKLTEKNAKFAVVATAFHRGGTISFHNSLESAIKARAKFALNSCECGCAGVVPVTAEARAEMRAYRDKYNNPVYAIGHLPLYANLPTYQANGESPYQLCR